MNKHSSKISAQFIFQVLDKIGVKDIVISPGSRSAPLVIESNHYFAIKQHVIVDERSAGFFAIGLSQKSNSSVALVCTSGTALLNYGPAAAEAFYQKRPLIFISADRPSHLISIGDNQTIHQPNSLINFTKASFHISENEDLEKKAEKIITTIKEATEEPLGPVHINIAFDEPLYEYSKKKRFDIEIEKKGFKGENLNPMLDAAKNAKRPMVLLGQLNHNPHLQKALQKLEDCGFIILNESTSNNFTHNSINCIDRFIDSIKPKDSEKYTPDFLITIGSNVISKKTKTWLRKSKSISHFHLGPSPFKPNTFFHLTKWYKSEPLSIVNQLTDKEKELNTFQELWLEREEKIKACHKTYLKGTKFCDLKVYEIVLNNLPFKAVLQVGNSSVIRYQQLFDEYTNHITYANRGTSGIDGSLSTAVGYATANPSEGVFCIIGDLSFFYDSNAFFNSALPPNLKIILVNNGKGDIFNIIKGPDKVINAQNLIIGEHSFKAKGICDAFKIDYFKSTSNEDIRQGINWLKDSKKCSLLEVDTANQKNAEILKRYFKFINASL